MDWSRWLGFDVFVSYRRDDSSDYSEKLVAILEERGLRCFLDHRETPAGALLDTEIPQSLAKSRLLVVVLTPGCFQSAWIREEIRLFSTRPRPLICVNIENALTRPEAADAPFSELRRRSWVGEQGVNLKNGRCHSGHPHVQYAAEHPCCRPLDPGRRDRSIRGRPFTHMGTVAQGQAGRAGQGAAGQDCRGQRGGRTHSI